MTSLRWLLEDESAKVSVLGFPKGHCWSSAMGFVQSRDGSRRVFVKDRDEEESVIQAAGSLWGQEFSKAFQLPSVVALCEYIERPSLRSLKDGSPAYQLWKLKEEKWKREFQRQGEEEKKEEPSCDDDEVPPPSDFENWLLEEAVVYYASSWQIPNDNPSDIDTSLRRKLRTAADRSPTGCLDLLSLLMLTQFTQESLATDHEWSGYKKYGLVGDPQDALTQEETHHMLHEKLDGVEFEVAALYATIVALPDVNVENCAVQEATDGPSPWHLRLVHFDTGVLPVSAGVSLEPLSARVTDGTPFDFLGKSDCTGFFMVCSRPSRVCECLRSVERKPAHSQSFSCLS